MEEAETTPFLSVNVVAIDYEMAYFNEGNPYTEDLDTAVPIVRIFGSTPTGQSACVHIHGVSYYVFI